jgi:hypothetical protein
VRRLVGRLPSRVALLLSAAAATCLALGIFSNLAQANDANPPQAPCTCPNAAPNPTKPPGTSAKPKFAETNSHLDENDEIAALEAIRVALTEVGDGGTYVWHRQHGRLSGMVQPTASFKDAAGRVCRHILVIMTVGAAKGRAEGIACRLADGRWQFDS